LKITKIKLFFIIVSIVLFASLYFLAARAGDIFLSWLGNELHIDLGYKNHSGFLSCFVLRFIELDSPAIFVRDFGVTLACRKAYITPDFSRVFQKQAILLSCNLKDAVLSGKETKLDTDDLFLLAVDKLQKGASEASDLLERVFNIVYDRINTRLVVYGNTVEFLSFEANSPDIKLFAEGKIVEDESLYMKAKVFFSPGLTERFPQVLLDMLTDEKDFWKSYSWTIESGVDRPYLKIDSDRIKINFETIEVK